MNRFARIMQGIGWIGVALLAGAWIQGHLVQGDHPLLARHSAIALAAALLCVLPRFWTITYLALASRGRAADGLAATTAGAHTETKRTVALRRRAWVVSSVALVALCGSFALAGAILLGRVSPWVHGIAGAIAFVMQVIALFVERRALEADAMEMGRLPVDLATPATTVS